MTRRNLLLIDTVWRLSFTPTLVRRPIFPMKARKRLAWSSSKTITDVGGPQIQTETFPMVPDAWQLIMPPLIE